MAYRPYKPVRNQDIYAKYDKKKEKKQENHDSGRIKIFGFRSGAPYKMIPAILYYAFMLFYVGTGIYGEIRYYRFEPMDVVLMILKYIFFIVLVFSPLIFLSDFKYRDNLPFFKKREIGSTLIGLILIGMFCYMMMNVNIYCMSDTWKESRNQYNAELIQKYGGTTDKEETQVTEETSNSEDMTTVDRVSYDLNQNTVYVQEVG